MEAYDELLAPVYGWFTEGLDSRSFISPTTGNHMITVPGLAAEALRSFLTTHLNSQIWIDPRKPY